MPAVSQYLRLLPVGLLLLEIQLVAGQEKCKKSPQSDILSFSNEQNFDEDIVRTGGSELLYCCANNFEGSVTWYRELPGGRRILISPSNKYEFPPNERQQRMFIRKVSMEDNGIFICFASNRLHSVTYTIYLQVLECDKAVGEVVPIRKLPPKVDTAVGETLTLDCLGFFGCGMDMFKEVIWLLTYENGTLIGSLDGDNQYFSVTEYSRSNGTKKGSRLTFKTVTDFNFTRRYKCVLVVPTHPKTFSVELQRKSMVDVIPLWLKVTLGVVGSFVCLSLIVLVLAYPRRCQIIFYFKTVLNCGWPARKEKVRYDVCLMSSQESAVFVSEKIYDDLTERGYSVFYHFEETSGGKLDTQIQMEGLQQSSHVLLYLSSEEEVDKIQEFFMQTCVEVQGGSKIIIIHNGPLEKSLERIKPHIQRKLRIVKRIAWPNCEQNCRQMKNFWCSLQLSLPRPGKSAPSDDNTNHNRHASTSSDQPLLDSS